MLEENIRQPWLCSDLVRWRVMHTRTAVRFAVLQALGHTCLIEPMLDLIRDAWNTPDLPRPSIYASNAAIAACARVGRMQEALDLYRDMVGSKPRLYSPLRQILFPAQFFPKLPITYVGVPR